MAPSATSRWARLGAEVRLTPTVPLTIARGPVAWDGSADGVEARPVDAVVAEASGRPWVALDGPEAASHPALLAVLRRLADAGVGTKLRTHGRDLDDLARLRDAGLRHLELAVLGGPVTHDRLVGRAGAHAAMAACLARAVAVPGLHVTVRWILLEGALGEVDAVLAQARLGGHLDVVRPARGASGRPGRGAALAALARTWRGAGALGVALGAEGFAGPPDRPASVDGDPPEVDAALWRLLERGVRLPGLDGGLTLPDGVARDGLVAAGRRLDEVGLSLAARGLPLAGAPPCLGGSRARDGAPGPACRGCAAAPSCPGVPPGIDAADCAPLPMWSAVRGPIAVVVPAVADVLLATSTLPALVRTLRALGADARLHSVWPEVAPEGPGTRLERRDEGPTLACAPWLVEAVSHATGGRAAEPAFLDRLDLGDARTVVVPGWGVADALLGAGRIPEGATLVVADLHCREGLEAWHARWLADGRRPMEGGWWPRADVRVVSLFPGRAAGYWRAGVPQRVIDWRAYPVDTEAFGAGPPAQGARRLVAAGSHHRDWRTLARAAAHVGVAVGVVSGDVPPGPLQGLGRLPLHALYERLAGARAVLVPLRVDGDRPAGLSIVALAQAAGRPVVVTCTEDTRHLVRDGVDGLLVRAGDARGWARALERVTTDDGLVARLAAGALEARARGSVSRWARDLLRGSAPRRAWGRPGGPWSALPDPRGLDRG